MAILLLLAMERSLAGQAGVNRGGEEVDDLDLDLDLLLRAEESFRRRPDSADYRRT